MTARNQEDDKMMFDRPRLIKTTFLCLTLFALLASTMVFVEAKGRRSGQRSVLSAVELFNQLELTSEQRARLRTIVRQHEDEFQTFVDREVDARSSLLSVIHDPAASDDDVRNASSAVSVVDADLALFRARLYGEIQPILTDEQKETVRAFLNDLKPEIVKTARSLGDLSGRIPARRLSEEQRSQMQAILQSHAFAVESLLATEIESREALVSSIRRDDPDTQAILEAATQVASVDADFAVERHRIVGEIGTILTEEQKQDLLHETSARQNEIGRRIRLLVRIGTRLI